MIQNPQSEPVSTARDIAEALGRSPNEKGVDRLAADLAYVDPERAIEQAARVLMIRTGADEAGIERSITVTYDNRTGSGVFNWYAKAYLNLGGSKEWAGKYGTTMEEAVEACVKDAKDLRRRLAIADRIEREMAEADAAEKALSSTAPLAFPADPALMFVPDGSVGDVLPLSSIGPSGIGGYAQTEIRADTRGGGA